MPAAFGVVALEEIAAEAPVGAPARRSSASGSASTTPPRARCWSA